MVIDGKKRLTESHKKALSEAKIGVGNPMFGTVSPKRLFYGTREDLVKLYVEEKHSLRYIADLYGCQPRTITDWLNKFGVKLTGDQLSNRLKIGRAASNTFKDNNGYVYVISHGHPNVNRDGYVAEHRLLMESFIGRYLFVGEQVHHINFDKADNRIENFILFPSAAAHSAFHKYLGLVGAYVLGHLSEPPKDLLYDTQILVRGKWVTRISMDSVSEEKKTA